MSRRINRYAIHLWHIGRVDTETLVSVLRTLGRAALRAEQRMNKVAGSEDGEYMAEVLAEETMLIEDLIGCAFVAAQSYITGVVSRVRWLHERLKRDGLTLATTDGKRPRMIKAFGTAVPPTQYTQIQVIDAFANYFKHHEQWPANWNNADKRARRTVAVIRAVGATENSADNCHKALNALGIHRRFDVFALAEILAKWHAALADAYKNELRSIGHS